MTGRLVLQVKASPNGGGARPNPFGGKKGAPPFGKKRKGEEPEEELEDDLDEPDGPAGAFGADDDLDEPDELDELDDLADDPDEPDFDEPDLDEDDDLAAEGPYEEVATEADVETAAGPGMDVEGEAQDVAEQEWAGDLYEDGDETDPAGAYATFGGGEGSPEAWLDRADDGTLTGWIRDAAGEVYRYSDADAWAIDVDQSPSLARTDAAADPAAAPEPTDPAAPPAEDPAANLFGV